MTNKIPTEEDIGKEIIYEFAFRDENDKPTLSGYNSGCSIIKKFSKSKEFCLLNGGDSNHKDMGWVVTKYVRILDYV